MLYEFRSRATGTVIMTADVAEPLLRALGKRAEPRGIITVAQLPAAIERLERAKAAALESPAAPIQAPNGHPLESQEAPEPVSFGQRAWPLLELLRAALAGGRDVTWGA